MSLIQFILGGKPGHFSLFPVGALFQANPENLANKLQVHFLKEPALLLANSEMLLFLSPVTEEKGCL